MRDIFIKVCGMRDVENIRSVVALGVDMIGFVFWKDSPRCVNMVPSNSGIRPDSVAEDFVNMTESITPDTADGGKSVAGGLKKVGVFVDEMPQNIVTRVYNFGLDYVQLHGSESAVMIDNLRRTLEPDIRPNVKIIKAISVETVADIDKWHEYEGVADMLLFDTKCTCAGGSGRQFDWNILQAYDGDIPFILSGGIGPDDVQRVKEFEHPMLAGIDLNSRFETEPAVKDVEALRAFVTALRG